MTRTLEQLEQDPTILRKAIELGDTVQVLRDGRVAGTFTPAPLPPVAKAGDAKPFWDIDELRAWRKHVWGDRVFTEAEEQEMRDAEDGAVER